MEKSPLPRYIKLKLEQPEIICSGRKKVECFYRGRVVEETEIYLIIIFKALYSEQKLKYNKTEKTFEDLLNPFKIWDDLKIV